ncbi:MAG TPA: diphthine--ammonia ligase [Candidatus Thermoplasmatota archaeon]|nr:diphthine--ammonia ligase [Candidatus Thermoplasmatota archaeon]
MRIAALVSGGKDSVLAAHVAQNHGWDLTHVVTVRPRAGDSWMFHAPNTALAPLLAGAFGLPLVEVDTPARPEEEVDDLERALAPLPIDGFVSGALASEYQRTRLERIGHRLGLRSFTPLWHKKPEEVLRTVRGPGWDVRFAAVAAEGLDEAWLGRRLDEQAERDLARLHGRHGIHVGGEGGEYETLVLDAPCYQKRIEVVSARKAWGRDSGTWIVEEARLAPGSTTKPPYAEGLT